MDMYFEDVDTYIYTDPNSFEDVIISESSLDEDTATELVAVANELDLVGLIKEAQLVDDLFTKLAAKYKNKTVTLNKPFRTPGGPKKFSVYVKNEKGNVVKVNFGDPNMKIKKNIPARRKSFRARHKCDTPGPKWKARYWSCRAW